MPIGRGIMISNRINIYETITTFTSITPADTTVCGNNIIFQVTVDTIAPSGPTPTGGVTLIDKNTGIPFGAGFLISGHAVIPIPLDKGNYNMFALYTGVFDQFTRSQSDLSPYTVTLCHSNTTINQISIDGYFGADVPFDASIFPIESTPSILTGTVHFRLYSSDGYFVSLPDGFIAPHTFIASSYIPAFTMIAGNTYYLQARYQGSGCYANSNSPGGTNGVVVNAEAS